LDARRAYDAGDFDKSMHLWPRRSGMERRVLARFIKTHKPGAAVHVVDVPLRRLWITALQSKLFNDVLSQRMLDAASIDHLLDGDMAYKHDNGACFHVESAAVEQPRCAAFEISPTGPLLGYRLSLPDGRPRQMEQDVFAAAGLTPAEFRQPGKLKIKGARRSLRVQPLDVDLSGGVDEFGPQITVAFTLPAGSFATVFLRELMKPEETAGE
jgi:tRNA pseudouridine13 synthase